MKIKNVIMMGLVMGSLCSCEYSYNFAGNYISYSDADKYSIGDFTYNGDDIDTIDLEWVSGSISVTKGNDLSSLSVKENVNGNELLEEQKLHYYIHDSVLSIQYCASGYDLNIDCASKKLNLEIPDGITFNIDTVSSPVTFTGESVSFKSMELNSVSASMTFNGKVNIDESLKIDTVSGNSVFTSVKANDMELNSTSGSFDIGVDTCPDIKGGSVSGDYTFNMLNKQSVSVSFSSVSGRRIDSYTPEDNSMVTKFDISTVSGSLNIK